MPLLNYNIKNEYLHLYQAIFKFLKTFSQMSDFKDIIACTQLDRVCKLQQQSEEEQTTDLAENKENMAPITEDCKKNPDLLTPISKWNLRWKNKSKAFEGNLTDSVSSIPNVSSFNHSSSTQMHKTHSPGAKLVRTTSTPMHRMFEPAKQTSFGLLSASSSMCQLSSINNNCSSESEISPFLRPTA